ncbi:MAG: enoyl-CoA hydratase/isomerase family protein [Chloroflexota bacterium]|nr:enoyl-CoA hydratase/isomerase family protein [Chloroflexota bacterium]
MSGRADTQLVRCRVDGGIAFVTLDRPPVNALSLEMWNAFTTVLDGAVADDTVSVLVLSAAGERVFSAGMDTKEAAALTPEQTRARLRVVNAGLEKLHDLPLPIVCALNGTAVGGGLNIAALCDHRIAADHAQFALNEIDHMRVAGGGAFLRRLGVPEGVLREMLFTGRRLSSAEALAAHIVDEVVPAAALAPRAAEVAAVVAAKPAGAARLMKRAILAAEAETTWSAAHHAADIVAAPQPEKGERR